MTDRKAIEARIVELARTRKGGGDAHRGVQPHRRLLPLGAQLERGQARGVRPTRSVRPSPRGGPALDRGAPRWSRPQPTRPNRAPRRPRLGLPSRRASATGSSYSRARPARTARRWPTDASTKPSRQRTCAGEARETPVDAVVRDRCRSRANALGKETPLHGNLPWFRTLIGKP